MSNGTKIEWTRNDDGTAGHTWNILVGCSKAGGPGCESCYAIGVVHRGMSAQHRGLTVMTDDGVDWTGEVRFVEHKLDEPLRRQKPTRYFVNSLSDVFHPAVSRDDIARIFAVMVLAEQHTFMILTKRPARMARLLSDSSFVDLVDGHRLARNPHSRRLVDWPRPNIWCGVSVETNEFAWRADHLRNTPAAVRFVSAEPLLGPLDQLDLTGVDWLIAGGESGPHARPMHPDWARDLRDRCVARTIPCPNDTNGDGDCSTCARPNQMIDTPGRHPQPVAWFFKQWGNWVPTGERGRGVICMEPDGSTRLASESLPGPRTVFMKHVDKATAGRLLDGREWSEFPAGRPS